MIVQWYDDGPSCAAAALFDGVAMVAVLPDCESKEDANERILSLGWRRREPWEKVEWGFQAKLRRNK